MKLSLCMIAAAFGYPIQQNGNWNFILPYYLAKRMNWTPNFNWNMPNINWNPIGADSKTFMKETLVPAYLTKRYDNTAMEAMNWYYYMKKNHPNDLLAINNLIPKTLLSAQMAQGTSYDDVKPYVAGPPVDLIPAGYEGQSFQSLESWGNGDDFFKGSNNRFPGK